MYFPDVVSLKQFYASALGRAVHALLWQRLRVLWPQARGEAILGLGFAAPYLSAGGENTAVVAMPAQQGALYWPADEASTGNRVALANEAALPFADSAFNRVLAIHALEHSDHLGALLRELWRVTVPGGRVLVLVPNRMGLWAWARSAESPFAYGRPFSPRQLREALSEGGFTYLRACSSLFVPPLGWRWVIRLAPWMEFIGQCLFPLLGGVLVVEAEKQVYAAIREPVRARAMMPAYSPVAPIVPST